MSEGRIAVFLAHGFGLLADIEDIGGLELHAVGRLHRLDAAVEIFVLPELCSCSLFSA